MKVAGSSPMFHILRYSNHLGFGSDFCSSSKESNSPPFVFFPSRKSYHLAIAFSNLTLSDHFSSSMDDCSQTLSSLSGGIVALGKFDALHVGHRELAIQASKHGIPYLLSFVGIAEVLGWEPRQPVVAKCDRTRVLTSWAPFCGNITPKEFEVNFSSVRHLSPEQFVKKLSQMGVSGVVAGVNYRFGYKAAGDSSDLTRLCNQNGLEVYIIDSVMDANQNPEEIQSNDAKEKGQVSSTRVRYALTCGDVRYVSELLGRPHRVLVNLENGSVVWTRNGLVVRVPRMGTLNLLPCDGVYDNCLVYVGEEILGWGSVHVGALDVSVECKEVHFCDDKLVDVNVLGIEFIG